MHDALHEHPHVGILVARDLHAAALAVGEQRVHVARDLLDERIAMTAEEWHDASGENVHVPGTIECPEAPRRLSIIA